MKTINRPLLTVLLLSLLALPACLAVSDDADVVAKTQQAAPSPGVAGGDGLAVPPEVLAAPDPNPWLPAWFLWETTRDTQTLFLLRTKDWHSPEAPLPNDGKGPPTAPPAALGDLPFC